MVAQKLFERNTIVADAWNFGPVNEREYTVEEIVNLSTGFWKKIQPQYQSSDKQFAETRTLFIDSSKAVKQLQWQPVWTTLEGLEKTIEWYRKFYEEDTISTVQQLSDYVTAAKQKGLAWA